MAKFHRAPNEGYGLTSPLNDVFPPPIVAQRVPAATDVGHRLGQVWINPNTNQAWTMTGAAAGAATWSLSSPGASDVDTINGLSPVAGNMIIDGGTNVTDANAGNTVTLNLDPAITLATSVTSPLYTAGAAVDVAIDAPAGQDIIFTMGDNAAANNVSFNDLAGNPVFTVDSNGVLSNLLGITVVGAITQTAGIVSLGADAAANAIDIGTGAAAKVVTIGSVTGAASLDLLCGTGNFTLEGNVASTYDISNTGVNTGAVNIAGGTGARTITIGGGGTGAKTIDIGAAASADVITIGDATGAGSLDLVCGTGNFTLEGNVATTYAISNVGVNTGQVDIAGGTGARAINIGAGGTGAKTIGIGAAASADVITIGDATGAGSLDLACGTGNFTLEGNVATTYQISNTGVNTGQVDIAGGTGARTINLGLGGTGIKTINIGTAATADVIAIGDATGAGSLGLDAGTGGFSLDSTGTSNISVTSAGLDLSLEGIGCAVRMTSTEAQNDAIYIEASAANGGVEIQAGTGGIRMGDTVDCLGITMGNIAPTAGRTIVIGSGTVVTAAVTDDISIGDGGATTNANSIKHVDINNGGVTLGEVNTYIATGAVTSGTHLTEICTGNVTAGTATLDICTGTGVQTVQIANGAGAKALTLGSTNTTSATTIQSGTGDITVTGTVQDLTANFVRPTGDAITFRASPVAQSILDTCVIPTGVAATTDLLVFENGMIMEQFIIGTQTILAPRMGAAALGLTVSCDLFNGDGKEYNFGAARVSSKHSFTIGTSPAFYMQLRFTCNDVSTLEPAYFGFRRTAANNAAYGAYTDFIGYGVNDGVAPGDCAISTVLNGGAQVNTDTNDAWVDGTTHTLQVLVSAAGVVTFTFDGAPPTVTQAFTFDNGDVVHPFWTHLYNATVAAGDEVYWESMEIGFQA